MTPSLFSLFFSYYVVVSVSTDNNNKRTPRQTRQWFRFRLRVCVCGCVGVGVGVCGCVGGCVCVSLSVCVRAHARMTDPIVSPASESDKSLTHMSLTSHNMLTSMDSPIPYKGSSRPPSPPPYNSWSTKSSSHRSRRLLLLCSHINRFYEDFSSVPAYSLWCEESLLPSTVRFFLPSFG